MSGKASVQVIGHCTRDPELVGTSGLCVFGVAWNRVWTDDKGEKHEKASFIDVKTFKKTGDICMRFLKKGSQVGLDGSLEQENWNDKESNKPRSKMVLMAERVHLLGSKGDSGTPATKTTTPVADGKPSDGVDFDDIPF